MRRRESVVAVGSPLLAESVDGPTVLSSTPTTARAGPICNRRGREFVDQQSLCCDVCADGRLSECGVQQQRQDAVQLQRGTGRERLGSLDAGGAMNNWGVDANGEVLHVRPAAPAASAGSSEWGEMQAGSWRD